jgi:cyclic pyranopterin phosphate synthase
MTRRKNPSSHVMSHLDSRGNAVMVDVSEKMETKREATASAAVRMTPDTLRLIMDRKVTKGDVFSAARIAGIMAAKKTPFLIPLCHPLNISSVAIDFEIDEQNSSVRIFSTVRTVGKTGVEMEALTAVALASLTIYDMCKAIDKGITITDIYLLKKTGGKSGSYRKKI